MLTLLSTLISFLMGGLPKLLDFLQDRSDKKHELALAQMQVQREMELRKIGFEAQERVENIHTQQLEIETKSAEKQSLISAQQAEMQAVYAHDMSLNEGISQWVKDLRAATRSLLTMGFYILLVLLDVGIFVHGYQNGANFNDMANQLWDEDTRIMFAAIIAFWFGGRAFWQMKVTGPVHQNYGFIHTQRVDEQARVRHHENLKNLQKMNRQVIQNVEQQRETQRLEMAKWDRVRQAREAYLGHEAQKAGHNETMQHVDIKV